MIRGAVTATPGRSQRAPRLLLVCDSLALGTKELLPTVLPGWSVTTNARIGRPLAEGMAILAAADVPRGAVLAISLFTNDEPTRTSSLAAAAAETLRRVGTGGCAVWATIARPPLDGVSYAVANELLTRADDRYSRLQVIPWADAVRAQPSLLEPDGVHPTAAGYRLRAELYTRAALACRAARGMERRRPRPGIPREVHSERVRDLDR